MPVNQQYKLQIEKLRELMAYLRRYDSEVQNALSGYRTRIAILLEQGLPAEVGQKFLNDFYQQSKNQTNKNSAVVNEQAIPYIARNIQGLEKLK